MDVAGRDVELEGIAQQRVAVRRSRSTGSCRRRRTARRRWLAGPSPARVGHGVHHAVRSHSRTRLVVAVREVRVVGVPGHVEALGALARGARRTRDAGIRLAGHHRGDRQRRGGELRRCFLQPGADGVVAQPAGLRVGVAARARHRDRRGVRHGDGADWQHIFRQPVANRAIDDAVVARRGPW